MSSPLFRVIAFRSFASWYTIVIFTFTFYLFWISLPLLGVGLVLAASITFLIWGRCRIPPECFIESTEDYIHAGKSIANAELNYTNFSFRSDPTSAKYQANIKFKKSTRGISAEAPFLYIKSDVYRFIATNKRYWLVSKDYAPLTGKTADLQLVEFSYQAEVSESREDDEVLAAVWEHSTKNGERDWRFKDNRVTYKVRRYGVTIQIGWYDLDCRLFSAGAQKDFSSFLSTLLNVRIEPDSPIGTLEEQDSIDNDDAEEAEEFDEDKYYDDVWPIVLGVEADATIDQIQAAYAEQMEQYNPQNVSHLGEKILATANEQSEAIKAAYVAALRARGLSLLSD